LELYFLVLEEERFLMRGESWKIGLTVFFFLAALYYLYPTIRFLAMDEEARQEMEEVDPDGFRQLQNKAIKLGLDLQGGMHVVLQVDRSELSENAAKDARERALEIIRNRVDEFGVAEPEIYPQGEDKIVVDLPALQDVERARQLIGRTAKLEFKLVESPENTDLLFRRIDQVASEALDVEEKMDTTSEEGEEDVFEDLFAGEEDTAAVDTADVEADTSEEGEDTLEDDIFADLDSDASTSVLT
jgi:preprotein translocase subunit SecD